MNKDYSKYSDKDLEEEISSLKKEYNLRQSAKILNQHENLEIMCKDANFITLKEDIQQIAEDFLAREEITVNFRMTMGYYPLVEDILKQNGNLYIDQEEDINIRDIQIVDGNNIVEDNIDACDDVIIIPINLFADVFSNKIKERKKYIKQKYDELHIKERMQILIDKYDLSENIMIEFLS